MVGSVRVLADDRRMSHESRETADSNFPLTYMGKNVLAPGQIQVEVNLEKKKNSQGKRHSTTSIDDKVFILNILEHEFKQFWDYKQWDFFYIYLFF